MIQDQYPYSSNRFMKGIFYVVHVSLRDYFIQEEFCKSNIYKGNVLCFKERNVL